MFGSVMLEVTIGVVFVYFLLSVVCTAFNEWVSRLLSLRSKTLEDGIRNLLGDEELANKLYSHPLVKGLYKEDSLDRLLRRSGRPSYVPAQSFALALFEIIAPTDPDAGRKAFQDIRDMVKQLPQPISEALLPLLDNAGEELEQARANVEKWFDASMDRVSGWYTRKIAVITLCFAVVVVGFTNADTIMMAKKLSRDETRRVVIVAVADEIVMSGETPDMAYDQVRNEIQELQLPLGWSLSPRDSLDEFDEIVLKTVGLVLTTLAVALGAPFWFDVLGKIASLRLAGKRPQAEPE